MVSEPTIEFWGVLALLLLSLAQVYADAYASNTMYAEEVKARMREREHENNGLYARLNLDLVDVLKEHEIHLNNVEEVKEVMKKFT